ncbi:hypothetical protein ACP4OV_009342 [Aristida adscensionis]
MCKRPLEMVVYDPAAAGAAQKRAKCGASPDGAAGSAALVPCVADGGGGGEPIDAVPLAAVAPLPPPPPPPVDGKEEPPCLRRHILPALRLRADLPVHYITGKTVTCTDVDAHQNRFRLPTDGVMARLRPLLSAGDLAAANLLKNPPPRQRRPPPAAAAGASAPEGDGAEKKKKKTQGRAHGGLPVRLVDLAAGASAGAGPGLRLSRWDSSQGTVVKGEGYLDFIRRCRFKEGDVVEIWAFKQAAFRHFGVVMCDESPLHLLIVKRDDQSTCLHCSRSEKKMDGCSLKMA